MMDVDYKRCKGDVLPDEASGYKKKPGAKKVFHIHRKQELKRKKVKWQTLLPPKKRVKRIISMLFPTWDPAQYLKTYYMDLDKDAPFEALMLIKGTGDEDAMRRRQTLKMASDGAGLHHNVKPKLNAWVVGAGEAEEKEKQKERDDARIKSINSAFGLGRVNPPQPLKREKAPYPTYTHDIYDKTYLYYTIPAVIVGFCAVVFILCWFFEQCNCCRHTVQENLHPKPKKESITEKEKVPMLIFAKANKKKRKRPVTESGPTPFSDECSLMNDSDLKVKRPPKDKVDDQEEVVIQREGCQRKASNEKIQEREKETEVVWRCVEK